jgi:hypothetical protein
MYAKQCVDYKHSHNIILTAIDEVLECIDGVGKDYDKCVIGFSSLYQRH